MSRLVRARKWAFGPVRKKLLQRRIRKKVDLLNRERQVLELVRTMSSTKKRSSSIDIAKYKKMKKETPEDYELLVQRLGFDPLNWKEFFRAMGNQFEVRDADKNIRLEGQVDRRQSRLEQLKKKKPLPRFGRKKTA